ncbi:hypothetical protein [Paenibacillus sp. SI8]|uniref:DUF6897 domain-containing protein n=1 Tax=unclassified Paenibacillus TaxID=185978 RepID=UPI003465B3EC
MSINYLSQLYGKEVKINRGGPDATTGLLVNISQDFLVLQTQDGVAYIQLQHIKSISDTKNSASSTNSTYQTTASHVSAYNFNSLLHQLRHNFVQINRGGPEKYEGFIADISSDYLLLVVKDEVIQVPVFHIKSINVINKQDKNNNNNNNNNNSNNNSNNNNSNNNNKNNSNKSSSNSNSSNKSSSNKNSSNKSSSNGSSNKSSSNKSSSAKTSAARKSAIKALWKKARKI